MTKFRFSEILDQVKSRGFAKCLRIAWGHFIFRKEKKIIAPFYLDRPFLDIQPPEGINIRDALIDDVNKIQDIFVGSHWYRSKDRLYQWISDGEPVLVAEDNGQIIGYMAGTLKIQLRDRLLLEGVTKAMNVNENDCWGGDAFVLKSYRGKHIYPALGIAFAQRAKQAGKRRILGSISLNNHASRAAHRRFGCIEECELSIWRILFLKGSRSKAV